MNYPECVCLKICNFAGSRSIDLKLTFIGKFTDGAMILLPW